MWCFVDESWHEGKQEHVGVLAAVLGSEAEFEALNRHLFRIRRKYYGDEHARNLRHELKGTTLFSNNSFKHQSAGFSKNLSVGREIIEWLTNSPIRLVGICVYGDSMPPLLAPQLKQLATPFRELCIRMIAGVPKGQRGQLIFDQRLGAQEEISISVHNYLAGVSGPKRLVPYPMIGVSNVWPGLQLADIVAHVLGRYATGDDRFLPFYRKLARVQMVGEDHNGKKVFGFRRIQWLGADQYGARKARTKK